VKIDFMAWETEVWIEGTREFLDVLSAAITDAEPREKAALERFARANDLEPEDYHSELEDLEHKFRHWLPRLSAYSVVILLHSVIETQLLAYAGRLKRVRRLALSVSDLKGKGLTAAKLYIIKAAGVEISNDLGWQELGNLQDLRNIIVHRRGRQGSSRDAVETVERLLRQYTDDLSLTDDVNPAERELEITFRLCRYFLEQAGAFFKRLCRAAGFQETAWKR